MATGDTLLIFSALNNEPPSANYATFDVRNQRPVLDFDQTTDEAAVFSAIMPQHYDNGGILVYLHWAATSATGNDVMWGAQFERVGEGQLDIDSDSFASAITVSATAPGTNGFVDICSISFTDGAQVDSIVAGEGFRLKVYRDADASGGGTDNMTGDAELLWVELREV